MAKVDPFPWSELPDAVALEGDLIAASEAFGASFDLSRIAALCSDLLGADWEDSAITSRSVTRRPTLAPWSAGDAKGFGLREARRFAVLRVRPEQGAQAGNRANSDRGD